MFRVLILGCGLLAGGAAVAGEPALEALVAQALASNPDLEALRTRERALRERSRVAGTWADPVLSIEYSNAPVSSFDVSDHPMGGLQLRVQQRLSAPGESRAQRDVVALRADAVGHATAEAELGLRAALAEAWWLLTRTRLLEALTREHLARTEELLGAARSRYETGASGQHAVLRLELLRDRLTDELGDFAATERELRAAVGRATGHRDGGELPTPAAVGALPPPAAADWLSLASEHRPALAGLGAERAAEERAADVARLQSVPDPSLWAGYRVRTVDTPTDPGTDLLSLGVAVPLPTGSARRGAGERRAHLAQAEVVAAQRRALLDAVAADMETLLARWARSWEKAQAHEQTLIPAARAVLDTTRADFGVGRADFASLFEAEVALLDLERARIAAAVETHRQRATALAVIGTPVAGAVSPRPR